MAVLVLYIPVRRWADLFPFKNALLLFAAMADYVLLHYSTRAVMFITRHFHKMVFSHNMNSMKHNKRNEKGYIDVMGFTVWEFRAKKNLIIILQKK